MPQNDQGNSGCEKRHFSFLYGRALSLRYRYRYVTSRCSYADRPDSTYSTSLQADFNDDKVSRKAIPCLAEPLRLPCKVSRLRYPSVSGGGLHGVWCLRAKHHVARHSCCYKSAQPEIQSDIEARTNIAFKMHYLLQVGLDSAETICFCY